jgi:hypothetical protein
MLLVKKIHNRYQTRQKSSKKSKMKVEKPTKILERGEHCHAAHIQSAETYHAAHLDGNLHEKM